MRFSEISGLNDKGLLLNIAVFDLDDKGLLLNIPV